MARVQLTPTITDSPTILTKTITTLRSPISYSGKVQLTPTITDSPTILTKSVSILRTPISYSGKVQLTPTITDSPTILTKSVSILRTPISYTGSITVTPQNIKAPAIEFIREPISFIKIYPANPSIALMETSSYVDRHLPTFTPSLVPNSTLLQLSAVNLLLSSFGALYNVSQSTVPKAPPPPQGKVESVSPSTTVLSGQSFVPVSNTTIPNQQATTSQKQKKQKKLNYPKTKS